MNLINSLMVTLIALGLGQNITNLSAGSPSIETPYINTSDPLVDLLEMDDFKRDYENHVYEFRESGGLELVNFCEYAYDTSFSDSFGLYLYIFNPYQSKPILVNDERNNVQISFSDDDSINHYYKYQLTFISSSKSSDAKNMFYKFKVDDAYYQHIYSQLSSEERIYKVSSIEFKLDDSLYNARDYLIGKTFIYSGFGKGINGNNTSTLKCRSGNPLTTIRCKTYGNYCRSDFVNHNATLQKDLFYVYFVIGNEYLENFGYLKEITYEYYLYHLYEQYVVKKGLPENIAWYLSKDASKYFSLPYENEEDIKFWNYGDLYSQLDNRYYEVDSENAIISAKDIQKRFFRKGESFMSADTRHTAYSGVLTATIDDAPLNIKSADLDYWLPLSFVHIQQEGTDWSNLKIIEKIENEETNSDGSTYHINPNDVTHFNNLYSSSQNNNQSMYLFRFYVGDSYSSWIKADPVLFIAEGSLINDWAHYATDSYERVGYRFKSDAIIDFDLISFTFDNNGQLTVIPVSNDPINIFVDSPLPYNPKTTTSFNWNLLFSILALIVLIIVVWYLVSKYKKWFKNRQAFKGLYNLSKSKSNRHRRRRK